MGNLNYVLYGRKGKEIRPDLYIVVGDIEKYREYEKYEKSHSKSKNIGSTFLVGIPHDLHDLNKGEMKKYVEELGKHLFGEHQFVGAVHKVETSNSSTGYNIHIHYNIADRLVAERSPVKYKRDVWLKEDGTLAKSRAERYKKIHSKGDYKLDEKGDYIYNSEPYKIKSNEFMDSNKVKWHRWNKQADKFNEEKYNIYKPNQWVKHIHLGYNPNKDMIRRNDLAKAINKNMNALRENFKNSNVDVIRYWKNLIGDDNSYKHTSNLEKINNQIVKDLKKSNDFLSRLKGKQNKINTIVEAKEKLDMAISEINLEDSKLSNRVKGFFNIKTPERKELERTRAESISILDSNVHQVPGTTKTQSLEFELGTLKQDISYLGKEYRNIFLTEKNINLSPINWNQVYQQNEERNKNTRLEFQRLKISKKQYIEPSVKIDEHRAMPNNLFKFQEESERIIANKTRKINEFNLNRDKVKIAEISREKPKIDKPEKAINQEIKLEGVDYGRTRETDVERVQERRTETEKRRNRGAKNRGRAR